MFRQLLFTLFFVIIGARLNAQSGRFEFSAQKMGSPFNIILYSSDSAAANNVAWQCFKLVDSLVLIYSDYLDSSELNKLCATAGPAAPYVTVSPALYDILLQAKFAYQKSRGSFDITLGPVTKLWRQARKEKKFPADVIVKEKLALTGFEKILIDTSTRAVRLPQTGMQLDLGGIAQGYIAREVIRLLKNSGVNNALVDISGDVMAIGSPPGKQGWTVAINVPGSTEKLLKRTLLIKDKAVTTSGDVYQFIEHDGKRFSHIIDPCTGYGITAQKNVTVIADDGTMADWLTKGCSILPIAKAKKLARSLQAEVLIAELKKGKIHFHATKGFARYWKK